MTRPTLADPGSRVWTSALLAAFVVALFAATPHAGALHDGQRYEAIARHPLSNDVGTPWSLRIGIPLVARLLPFSLGTSFFLLAGISAFVAGLLVAAIARQLDLPERHARAAGVLVIGTGMTVTSFWTYYIDIHVLALVAAAVYLSRTGRRRALIALTAGGTVIKEIVMLVGVIPALARGRTFLRTSVVATGAALAVYLAIDRIAPHGSSSSRGLIGTQIDFTRIWLDQIWRIGIVRYSGNALLATFGLTWVFWWTGFVRAPGSWRRLLVWIPLTLPLFVTAQWERTFALYTPLLVPLALLGARELGPWALTCFTAGSVWVAAGVEALTIGDDRITPTAHKLLLMAPGFALAAAALALAFLPRPLRQPVEAPGADRPGGVVSPGDP